MKRPLGIAASIACAALLVTANRAAAQANSEPSAQTQAKSTITFSAPVRVPGATLPAGEYIFSLANPVGETQTVEILQKDGTPVARVVTAPLARTADNTSEVMLYPAAAGDAAAVRAWFDPGMGPGHQFVYSRAEARALARAANADVLAADLPAPQGREITIVRLTAEGQEQPYGEKAAQGVAGQSVSSGGMIPYSGSETTGTSGSAGTTGSVGTTGSAGTSGAVGTTGATSATGAIVEHSGATASTTPATSGGSTSMGQSSTAGQAGTSGESASSSSGQKGEKDEHINQAPEEQRREAAKYLDRANSLLQGASDQFSNANAGRIQQLRNELQALQRAYETTRPGSAIKDPDTRNWEEQYRMVLKDLAKVSNDSVGTSGRTSESGSTEMGSASRSTPAAASDDTLSQVRMNLQRFHDIATGKNWKKK